MDSNNEARTSTEPIGIWSYFMNRLSDRTGLSIYWLQFILLLAGAFIAFLLHRFFLKISWDSAALLFWLGSLLSAFSGVVLLLPSLGRRIVVSLVILFHFGGILTAVTSVNPAPWLSTQVWTTVYRPYLYFLWLNNAYHFYSPQPGPANILWFCIEYESDPDGTRNFRWVLVPDWDEKGRPVNPDGSYVFSGTEYTRRLSLAEYTANANPSFPLDFYMLLNARLVKGQRDRVFAFDPHKLSYEQQRREPDERSKKWIQTYVRHVAATYKHQNEKKRDLPVKTVKFYRVLHQILEPGQVKDGLNPNDPSLYYPYYCGEFDKDGNFTDRCVKIEINWINGEGFFHPEVRDPYLYWAIPVECITRHAQGAEFIKIDSNMREVPEIAPEGNEGEVKQ